MFKNLFGDKSVLDIEKIMKILDTKDVYVHNGTTWRGENKEYKNDELIKIGINKAMSGYGDWGGGASHAITYTVQVFIKSDFSIHKIETDSFYNGDSSLDAERKAKKFLSKNKFKTLKIPEQSNLYKGIVEIFSDYKDIGTIYGEEFQYDYAPHDMRLR